MGKKQENKRKLKLLTVIQAAEEIFLQKPYSAITVDEIARKAGVTKKTLYSYFPSKLALFIHMFDDYLQRLHRQVLQIATAALRPDEALRRMFDIQFNFTWENAKFMRLFWTLESDEFNGELPAELVQSIKTWNCDMIDRATDLLRKGQKAGLIQPVEPEILVNLMSAVNKGFLIHTRKQSRLSISNIDPQKLKSMFWELISPALFRLEPLPERMNSKEAKEEADHGGVRSRFSN